MANNYKPGQWRVVEYNRSNIAVVSGVRSICRMYSTGNKTEILQKNAYLIAAAPDLLEACKKTFNLWEKYGLGDEDKESEPIYYELKAAIKKAENVD